MSDIETIEHMRLIYLIEGLQDELDVAGDTVAYYRERDTILKKMVLAARRRLQSERRNWLVHGLGFGFIAGWAIGRFW